MILITLFKLMDRIICFVQDSTFNMQKYGLSACLANIYMKNSVCI